MTQDEIREEKRMGGRESVDEMRKECNEKYNDRIDVRMCAVNREFRQGFDLIRKYPTSVTMFGSARFDEHHKYYKLARETARRIVEETGYAILTGGGPGIMEAGNRGAKDGGGVSIGITIDLPFEQHTNPYVDHEAAFYYFFSRKVVLSYSSEAYVYFPGGFGTMDEFFEILTLVQTKKTERLPIILMGSDFWKPLDGFIRSMLLEEQGTITEGDQNLYTITDDIDRVVQMIQDAPINRQ
ncbi:MAG: TIGR00730 family Rossman fold protein [Candidatus Yonathbacteria bacterium]|nr:TIGR00730 family Rossman fold protein [Candidatus Yonathbacteria bacterium]NTW48006.1 TIGR00730 family Rossman fold protein [Candidatus Yonathbacteria bacterium]